MMVRDEGAGLGMLGLGVERNSTAINLLVLSNM